jgi:hypothetical protein
MTVSTLPDVGADMRGSEVVENDGGRGERFARS